MPGTDPLICAPGPRSFSSAPGEVLRKSQLPGQGPSLALHAPLKKSDLPMTPKPTSPIHGAPYGSPPPPAAPPGAPTYSHLMP